MIAHVRKAFFYSLAGLTTAVREETAFRIVLAQAALVAALAFLLPIAYAARAFLLLSAFICVIVELFNSALENVVDLATSDWHILAKKAKDMGSAAQFAAQFSLIAQILLIILAA